MTESSPDLDSEERAKREAIARQETEHFDVLGSAEDKSVPDVPTLEEPPPPPPGPTRERIPGDPLAESDDEASADASYEEEEPAEPGPESAEPEADESSAQTTSDPDAFDEKLLSEELDQALEVEPPSPRTSFFDESDEYRVPQRPSRRRYAEDTGGYDHESPDTDEGAYASDEAADESAETGESREWQEVADEDDEAGTGEDVLEETPEFLEETPEHDRLWFEQRPPKDFDFND